MMMTARRSQETNSFVKRRSSVQSRLAALEFSGPAPALGARGGTWTAPAGTRGVRGSNPYAVPS